MLHLAVIHPTYARLILEGRKTIESRLSRVCRIPHNHVAPGERIYFLARRADLIVTAIADQVVSLADLSPGDVSRLRRTFNAHIAADAAYWHAKRDARYATLIWLRSPERALYAPDDVHGRAPSYRSAWLTRPDEQDVYPACVTPRRAIA
ncbi:MAG: ASCH domain-containing protein [Leptolyngbya sp. PLA3]|nr:MAG: ASCH domain-containing protein [Cyanobacteria bacterium CYA]MCE7969817.1 ASCH domain-containing protein [Leptolyngbya sp. PL-A3]